MWTCRAIEMVKQEKGLAMEPDDLSLIPRTCVAEGENQVPEVVL